jgi:hypothetical protein
MFYILTTVSLFLNLGNENLCQATGPPIYDIKPLSTLAKHVSKTKRPLPPDFEDRKAGSKRQCTEKGVKPNGSQQCALRMVEYLHLTNRNRKNSPSNISITRNRMFYARPDNGRRSSGLQVGLPSSRTPFPCSCRILLIYLDILNRIMTQAPQRGIPREKQALEDARLVAEYIFPRQYGLHNVFDFEKERGAWPFRDYSRRDGEIEVSIWFLADMSGL